MTVQPATSFALLAEYMSGEVITPEHPEYETARRVWNGMIDKRPAAIAMCADADDVSVALHFAAMVGLPISVRGGGHNVAGTAVVEDGIVIDLSALRAVHVHDTGSGRTVHVQGGATWADVDRVTQRFGLATTGGVVSETGVAGLALSGGVSSQRRAYGMTIDNLLSAEVVLADGRKVRASKDENPDLFWAIRGGGGNFGVVTSFEFRLHEIGPDVFSLLVAYPVQDAARVLAGWRDAMGDMPDEVNADGFIWTLPVHPDIPEHLRGVDYVGVVGMYAGDPAEGERVMAPLRTLATPLIDMSMTLSYLDKQSSLDAYFPAGLRYYWKALYLDGLSDEAIDSVAAWCETRPSKRSFAIIRNVGGAVSRVGAEETAFGDRSSEWMLSIDSTWEDAADDDANIGWTRAFFADAERFSQGKAYFNFPGLHEEGDALVRSSYGANHDRLAAIKAAYDPQNRFRLNQNIRPAA